eukprot:gene32701-43705_t
MATLHKWGIECILNYAGGRTIPNDTVTLLKKEWLTASREDGLRIVQTAGCPVSGVSTLIEKDRLVCHKKLACCGVDQITDRFVYIEELEELQ